MVRYESPERTGEKVSPITIYVNGPDGTDKDTASHCLKMFVTDIPKAKGHRRQKQKFGRDKC